MISDEIKPLNTCPNAMRVQRGMMGFVKINSKSNWTASAAFFLALYASLGSNVICIHFHIFSGMIAPTTISPSSCTCSTSAFRNCSDFLVRSASVSFFFRCRTPAGNSLFLAAAAFIACVSCGAPLLPALSGVSCSFSLSSSTLTFGSSSTERLALKLLTKTTRRRTGRMRKWITVGIGPMSKFVTNPKKNRTMPKFLMYMKKVFSIRNKNNTQRKFNTVVIKPAWNVTKYQTQSVTKYQ
mmetsp:Transcript_23297/g.36463  ORF Transcript_23297/g.36463 Transcript_23297/m.36463 type:complete len:240 (-) Transcript_23297:566-1285(-)